MMQTKPSRRPPIAEAIATADAYLESQTLTATNPPRIPDPHRHEPGLKA